MVQLVLKYKLKTGVTKPDFENWVKTTDYPKMRSLERVKSFRTFRAEKLLIGDGSPSVEYIELFEIPDLEGFTVEDMPGDLVQSVMGEFMWLVEAPEFIIVSEVE